MKGKKILLIVALILSITSVTVYAATNYKSPADIASKVTGKPVEEVVKEKVDSNKSYGELAKDQGKLEEFKNEMFDYKKEVVKEKIEEGAITKEEGDKFLAEMEKHQEFCNGTGRRANGESGMAFGFGHMMGKGHHGGENGHRMFRNRDR